MIAVACLIRGLRAVGRSSQGRYTPTAIQAAKAYRAAPSLTRASSLGDPIHFEVQRRLATRLQPPSGENVGADIRNGFWRTSEPRFCRLKGFATHTCGKSGCEALPARRNRPGQHNNHHRETASTIAGSVFNFSLKSHLVRQKLWRYGVFELQVSQRSCDRHRESCWTPLRYRRHARARLNLPWLRWRPWLFDGRLGVTLLEAS